MFDVKTVFVNNGSDESLLKSMADEPTDKINQEELEKAMDRSGLVQREITAHGKHGTYTRKQWVRASDDGGSGRRPRAKEEPKSYKKTNSATSQYLKSISAAFKKGTVVDVRTSKGEFRGEVLSISVGSKGSMVGKIKDSNGRVHKITRGIDSSFEPCSKDEAEEFLGRQLFPVRYFPVGENSSKGYSEGSVKEHYMKNAKPGVTFDEYTRENYFISDGYTKTDNFYKKDGQYTPERQELHRAIVGALLDEADFPPEGEKPVCYLFGGGSASGKGSVVNPIMKSQTETTGVSFARIDSDEIKKDIPEYESFQEQNLQDAALRVHDESSDIANMAFDELMEQGKCFAFDGTMKNRAKYNDFVDRLHGAGYDVVIIGVDIPTDEAIKRSDARGEDTGRYVPHSIIRGSHGGFAELFPDLKEKVDNYFLYDNSQPEGEPPTLVCHKNGGVVDQPLWDRFLKKGNDHRAMKASKSDKKGGK